MIRFTTLPRLLAAASLAAGAFLATAAPASAWGCHARDRNSSSYGYSTRYSSQSSAMNRALNECRAHGGRRCYITSCAANR